MQIDMANLERTALQELLEGAITPLPVALISTIGPDGIYNAAPFSLVFPVCWQPPIVCASFGWRQGRPKDTSVNIAFSRDFVINIMDESRIKATARAAADYPADVDEMKEVGLTAAPAAMVKSPRVAEAQVSLECRLVQGLKFGDGAGQREVIFGEVVMADDALLIPTAAVMHDGPHDRVWVVENPRVHRRDVRLGPNNFDLIQIREGLSAGDLVVVHGKSDLVERQRVKSRPAPPMTGPAETGGH